ncbi:MAG: beta-galactosidase trimerization domain-containing protein [Planctomycetota bacterium]|jgi:hypothetical protein
MDIKNYESEKESWWKQGLLIAGGWHPLSGRIRNRIPEEDIEDEYMWEYTEEYILRLKDLGISLVIGQFDRGFGETDQEKDQELARQQAELCHKHGLYHGVYLPNTIYYESVLKDNPECRDWVTKTYQGRESHFGGEQTWRWLACFNSPGWRARMKREIEKAIKVVKTDLLHFDNMGQALEPDGCHCDYCQEKFKDYLSEKYSDAESQVRRFGFTGFDKFQIPLFWEHFSMPWHRERIQNPLLQEWIMFRNMTTAEYFQEMKDYARELKPDIAVDSNGQNYHGNNTGLSQGRSDVENISKGVNILWDECPDLRPDEDIDAIYPTTKCYRTMIYARNLGKEVLAAFRSEEDFAFNISFAGNPGINAMWGYAEPGKMALTPPQPGVKELIKHYRGNPELYNNLKPAAKTAVWRNYKSLSWVSTDTHLSVCVMEQMLFNNRVPFTIVSDGFINSDNLKAYELLIIPDVEFINEEQVAAITSFIENGGNVLITEKSGMYTDEPRIRKNPAFSHLFAGKQNNTSERLVEAANIDESSQFKSESAEGKSACAVFGKGKVVYLPEIKYRYLPGTFESNYNMYYNGIDSRYWKNPHNTAEIISMLEWLSPVLYPVKIHGAGETRIDYLEDLAGKKVVQLVRCGDLNGKADIPVSIRSFGKVTDIMAYMPEDKEPVQLTALVEVIVPAVYRHAVLVY